MKIFILGVFSANFWTFSKAACDLTIFITKSTFVLYIETKCAF